MFDIMHNCFKVLEAFWGVRCCRILVVYEFCVYEPERSRIVMSDIHITCKGSSMKRQGLSFCIEFRFAWPKSELRIGGNMSRLTKSFVCLLYRDHFQG